MKKPKSIKSFFQRCLRKIRKIIFKKKIMRVVCQYTGQKSSDLIYEYINNDKPCMIARFGATEFECITNYIKLKRRSIKNFIRYMKGEDIRFGWAEVLKHQMRYYSGFFPETDENLEKFSQLMLDCIPDVDILGSWLPDEILVKDKMPNVKTVRLFELEPYYHNNPWTAALEGKTVLVIHPFTESIKKQYLVRDKLFEDKNILPKFKLETIKAVQSLAYNDCGYKSWFDALEAMKFQIMQKEYDVAIIGCGAYGFPLASFVKRQGKKSIHLAGATQLLFGIKGARWDTYDIASKIYNDYWIRPSEEETIINKMNVENGCYW